MQVAEIEFDKEQTLEELESTFELPPEPALPVHVPKDPEAMQLELYGINQTRINGLRVKCLNLAADTRRGYEETRNMLGLLRKIWVRTDKRRLELNKGLQEEIRWHNSIAKQIIDLAHELGDPLAEKLRIVDEAKEREKRALADAEAKRIEDERLAKIAAEEAERRAAHEAEQARLAKEREELAAERKRIDALLTKERAEAAEKQLLEQARLDEINRAEKDRLAKLQAEIDAKRAEVEAEQRKIREAKEAAERVEFERQAKLRAEQEAAEKLERDRLAAEARAKAEQAERERIEAARPDVEKVRAYGAMIRALPGPPRTESHESETVLLRALGKLALIADELEAFTFEKFNPAF